ncbi:MAG: hypothetical protein K8R90_11985 [Candidatus Cloacimonetes bacterium]|nr:hypothetical protein [Candidatus Cloacimonadota bacterium]
MLIEQGTRPLNILLNVEPDFVPRARWALETFFARLGCRIRIHERYASERVQIYYGPPTALNYPIKIRHNPDAASFFNGETDYPDSKLRFFACGDDMLPFLFSPPGEVFHVHGKQINIRKDIVASAFYFLSCWQEHTSACGDDGRHRYSQTLQSRWNLAHVPIVDRYAGLLQQAVSIALPQVLFEPRWPDGKSMAVSLSHDLDYWNYWTKEELGKAGMYNLRRLPRAPLNAIYKLVGHQVDKRLIYHPSRRNSAVVQHEQRRGYRSTTFVISDPEMSDSRQNYLVDQGQELKDFLTIINDRMVQLHGCGEASENIEALREQLLNLQQSGYRCRGYRAHMLRFDYDITFDLIERCGLAYDSSLGWWEHTGYRAGTGTPFRPYCHRENRPYRVLEIPLTVMDTTLHSQRAMKLSAGHARRLLGELVRNGRKHGGHLSLLWHYRTFDPIDFPAWRRLYWWLLNHAAQQDAWLCSLDEMYDHWTTKLYIQESS